MAFALKIPELLRNHHHGSGLRLEMSANNDYEYDRSFQLARY